MPFNWFTIDDWSNKDLDIKLSYCDTTMNPYDENNITIQYTNEGGKVYMNDDPTDYYEFEYGYI